MKRAAIYARVSTDGQTNDNQVAQLREAAQRHGWEIVKVYSDHASGAQARRPGLDTMMKAANRREFDVIMAWDVSRLGRSLQHLVTLLDEIHAKGVDLYLHGTGVDTTTPAGKAMFQMAGVFAEFERSMICERTMAGLKRAKAQGKTLGRPKVPTWLERDIRRLRKQGMGMVRISKQLGCGVSTVTRVCREMATA